MNASMCWAITRIQQLDITDETVTWVVEDRRHRLEILATRSQGTMLRAPTIAEIDNGLIQGKIYYRNVTRR